MNDLKRIIIIFLALVLVVMGVLGIKGLAEDEGYKTQVRYITAIQAEEQDRFNYAVDSQQGNLLVHGSFNTDEDKLVKFDEMTKKFSYVKRTKEHYTMHTRTVCSGSGKSRSCHTETYYTWDTVNVEEKSSPELTLYGRKYPADKFNVNEFLDRQSCEGITKANTNKGWFSRKDGCEGEEYYLGNDDRYVYNIIPQSFNATFLASSMGGGLNPVAEDKITLQDKSIKQTLDDVGKYKMWAFWIAMVFIILLIIGACVGAYYWVMEDGKWSLDE